MLIGISGKAQAGKDTFARHLIYAYGIRTGREFAYKPMYYSYDALQGIVGIDVVKFAGALKQIVSILTGILIADMEDAAIKDRKIEGWDMTLREMLQRLGTDLIKNQLDQDAWIKALFSKYDDISSWWIVTDVRFPNEAKKIREMGGNLIRINRPGIKLMDHPTETGLDDWADWDMVVENDKDIDKLMHFANEFITQMFKEG